MFDIQTAALTFWPGVSLSFIEVTYLWEISFCSYYSYKYAA